MQKKKYDLSSDLVDISSGEEKTLFSKELPPHHSATPRTALSIAIEEAERDEFKVWCARNKLKMNEAFLMAFKLLKEKFGH